MIGLLPRRMLRAALLEADLYEEVEADRSALGQATLVVLLACAATALGRWLHALALGVDPADVILDVILDVIEPLVLWLAGSAFVYMVGATFLRGPETETDYREVLRTVGFAFTPALLKLPAFQLPGLTGELAQLTTTLWVLLAGVVAVRQACDFTTLRAVGTYGTAYALLWLVLRGIDAALS